MHQQRLVNFGSGVVVARRKIGRAVSEGGPDSFAWRHRGPLSDLALFRGLGQIEALEGLYPIMNKTTKYDSLAISAAALPLAQREAIVRRFNERVTGALLPEPSHQGTGQAGPEKCQEPLFLSRCPP